jgi:hypothetical protein
MFDFTRARGSRAAQDFVQFFKNHIPAFGLSLAASALGLPLVHILAGADIREEAQLLVVYGLFGPIVLTLLALCLFCLLAGGRIYAEQTAKIAVLDGCQVDGESTDAPLRNVGVAEAVSQLAYGAWGHSFYDAALSHEVDVEWASRQFHQAAADGQVSIWGKPGSRHLYEPIDSSFWFKNTIDWFSLLHGKPHTEPTNPRELRDKYFHLMTNRAQVERLFRNQPPELIRAKSLARQLAVLGEEGNSLRNEILRIIEDYDHAKHLQKLSDWEKGVLSKLKEAGISEADCRRLEKGGTYCHDLHGDGGRPEEQAALENAWNKKLQILRHLINVIGERT